MKQQNRRKFIAGTLAMGAATLTAAALPFDPKDHHKMLVHHALFWLKNPDSKEDRDKLVEGVKSLGAIETIRKLHVGVVASTEKRDVVDTSWAVSEIMFFDDEQGQLTYQTHPVHLKFIEDYGHLWSKVIVYDAMDV